MNPLDLLFGQISREIQNHASPDTPGPAYDANGILGTIGSLFGQHAQQSGQDFGGYGNNSGIAPSSQDPFGDPADSNQSGDNAAFGDVRPASEDPFGDPADQR